MITDTDLIGIIAASCVMSAFIIGLTLVLAKVCHSRLERMRRKQLVKNISGWELETEPNYEHLSAESSSEAAGQIPRRMSGYRPKILSEQEETAFHEQLAHVDSRDTGRANLRNETSGYHQDENGVYQFENPPTVHTDNSDENNNYKHGRREAITNGYINEGFIPVSYLCNNISRRKDNNFIEPIERYQHAMRIMEPSINTDREDTQVVNSIESNVVLGGHIIKPLPKYKDNMDRETWWDASGNTTYAERRVHDVFPRQDAHDDSWAADDEEEVDEETRGKTNKKSEVTISVHRDQSGDADSWLFPDILRASHENLRASRQEDNTSTKRQEDSISLFYSDSKNCKVIKKHSAHKPPQWLVETYAESAAAADNLGSSTRSMQYVDTNLPTPGNQDQVMGFSEASVDIEDEELLSVMNLIFDYPEPDYHKHEEPYTIIDYVDYDNDDVSRAVAHTHLGL